MNRERGGRFITVMRTMMLKLWRYFVTSRQQLVFLFQLAQFYLAKRNTKEKSDKYSKHKVDDTNYDLNITFNFVCTKPKLHMSFHLSFCASKSPRIFPSTLSSYDGSLAYKVSDSRFAKSSRRPRVEYCDNFIQTRSYDLSRPSMNLKFCRKQRVGGVRL